MWYYKNKLFDGLLSEFDSFVYVIERINILEDSLSPIYYIGKKTFYKSTKYNGKRITVESDWWSYYGSSDTLQRDVDKYGEYNFKRTILHLCRTKGEAGYLEAKEQIDRNVLHVDDDGYKLYYNKNVLGIYRHEAVTYCLEGDLQDYFNMDNVHGNNYNKQWVTNSKSNRLLSKKQAEELVSNSKWSYGKCEKHIQVNDTITNFVIPKSQFTDNYRLGWLKKYVTDGKTDKLLPEHMIHEYLEKNQTWYIGYSKNSDMVWITNGTDDVKVTKSAKDEYIGYILGRTNSGKRDKISIFKDDMYKWIDSCEESKYVSQGWVRKGKYSGYKVYNVTNNINQKRFLDIDKKNEFLNSNTGWRDGQLNRDSFTTKNTVFAKDIRTGEKISVCKQDYSANKYLVSVKTKKVKIKKRNRGIFTGYLALFLLNNDKYSERIFRDALRSESGDVVVQKGKYKFMGDEALNIKWL